MSGQNWTPEPWGIEQTKTDNWIGRLRSDGKISGIVCRTTRGPELKPECQAMHDADAQRIVACVNALSGIPDPAAFRAAAESVRDLLGKMTTQRKFWNEGSEVYQQAMDSLLAYDAACAPAGRADHAS